ncbi:unnamed protein product [Caenorhabditis sp. 36 PRJEB53466]|nr:unnamed protein product [Caenorhabditis sp. 36 PRJEB53466]
MAAFPLFSLSRGPLKCVFDQLDHTTILEIAKGSKTAKRYVKRLEMPVKLCCVFMDINTRMSVSTAGQEARVYYDNPDCSWSPNEVRWTYQQMEELARRLVECFEVECHVTIDSLLDCVKSIKDLFVWKHGIDCPYIEVHDALMTDAEFEFLFDYSAATHDLRPIGRHLVFRSIGKLKRFDRLLERVEMIYKGKNRLDCLRNAHRRSLQRRPTKRHWTCGNRVVGKCGLFFHRDESGKPQLNSTAVYNDVDDQSKENVQKEWKLSPIVAEGNRSKPLVFRNKIGKDGRKEFKTPLRHGNSSDPTTSGFEPKSEHVTTARETSSLSAPKLSMSADLSSYIANNSLNPFDSILLNSLHKSINFSPRVVFSQESCSTQKDGEKFQWSVEQLAILKPAHISEDEIAASYRSPIPEVEEKIQEALNEYWSNNVSYIPSPDGPRYVHLPHRDGTVTTWKCGEGPSTFGTAGNTPSLSKMVRKKEAVKAAYATSSPKQRPRRNVRQMRNRTSQTELTIPPSADLKALLGDAFTWQKEGEEGGEAEEEEEEVFNVSVSSNISTRRRLFSTDGGERRRNEGEEEEEEEEGEVDLTTDDPLLNDSNAGRPFNDSLSPVRRSGENTDELEAEMDEESSRNQSAATRSHVSQIAINVSILNDCMMHSIDEQEQEETERKKESEEDRRESEHDGAPFTDTHLHANEYEMLDRSSSTNATPRHEDLDWTPRRIGPASVFSATNSASRSGPQTGGAQAQADFRRFLFDMSPIHPNGNGGNLSGTRTPIQRCHVLSLPRSSDDYENENDDDELKILWKKTHLQMKLFVHNFMSSRFLKNVTVGYPLELTVKQFVEKDVEFDRENTILMLERIQYDGLLVAAAAVNQSERIPAEKPANWNDLSDEQLKEFHHVLMNIDVIDGELVCPETKTVFPIRDGIPNMLKVEAEN